MLALRLTFALLSALLLLFTLSRPHRHRWPRFFAFETLLGLVTLNGHAWFRDPFSRIQILSWLFLASSLALALHGFHVLRLLGAPQGDLEATTQLVTQGAYRFIRHPLYASLLLAGWGAFLKDASTYGLVLVGTLLGFVFATGVLEEQDNLRKFGQPYREYMRRTKMFIPFVL